jgi:hypothetical protein
LCTCTTARGKRNSRQQSSGGEKPQYVKRKKTINRKIWGGWISLLCQTQKKDILHFWPGPKEKEDDGTNIRIHTLKHMGARTRRHTHTHTHAAYRNEKRVERIREGLAEDELEEGVVESGWEEEAVEVGRDAAEEEVGGDSAAVG